ncbi:NAD+ synthase [Helicobacter sp. MIT 21-1697]|uniref:NAD+ synthase n=1 Tax=Helicobacter sp. MIT 21-1697 TaxID=2993733 RepID=UPI00224ACBEE|nr:NAD+ synthase [Helicobacter sp. MIT 21-1697]MCX2717748.1 NAD+ synthase [Helicobacter sp. MIT 21-1697]
MEHFVNPCIHFIQKQLQERGFKKVVLGLSGGIDSAVVATLATLALGSENVRVLLMPSLSSNEEHFNDALNLAHSLELKSKIIQLAPFQQHFAKQEAMDFSGSGKDMENIDINQKIRMGNFCARIRMALLYDCANVDNALVLGTSNKSEILLGYGTIFGDLAYAINPIGGLYKTQIFALALALNVPQKIIAKKPSADLFANQSDEADLGYDYTHIDAFLRAFEKLGGIQATQHKEREHIKHKLKNAGFEHNMIESLSARVWNNAFKRTKPTILELEHEA